MDTDSWGEVINGPQTITEIAKIVLKEQRSVIIGWTDGRATHHDVLFTYHPVRHGTLQGGLQGGGYLFVSIMRVGAFGFAVDSDPIHPDYIREKLRVAGDTGFALAVLISGVMIKMIEMADEEG